MAAALIAIAGPGCYSTWDIAPGSLRVLRGFREGQTRVISSEGREDVPFTSDTELFFRGHDGLEVAAKFRSIEVRGSTFTGVEREHGALIEANLAGMTLMQAKNFSVRDTVGLSVGLAFGIPSLAAVTFLAVVAGNYDSSK
jgi:hypothetical protein